MAGQITVHPFDATLMLREAAAGNLAATATLGPKEVWGMLQKGLAVQVVIPSRAAGADTLKVEVQLSADNVTYNTVATNVGGAHANLATDGEVWVVPFQVPAGRWYVKIVLTVTGAAPNFGAVVAGIIPNPGGEYDRANHWL